jgi:hypothetical protein
VLLSPTLTLVCALSLDSFANISGDIGQGNSTTFVAFQTAEEGSSISALQLALESFILGSVVLVFFFVGGRCERESTQDGLQLLCCRKTFAQHSMHSYFFFRFPLICIRCIARIDKQLDRSKNTQSLELQRKMYYALPLSASFFLQRIASVSVLSVTRCLRMYGIVGAVFVAFVVRFCFTVYLAYLNIGVSQFNRPCSPIKGVSRCGTIFRQHYIVILLHRASVSSAYCRSALRCSPNVLVEHLHPAV